MNFNIHLWTEDVRLDAYRKMVDLLFIKSHTVCNIHSSTFQLSPFYHITRVFTKPCVYFHETLWILCTLFSCPDSWQQEQLHPVFPQVGLVGQQTGETGIFIRYYGKHVFSHCLLKTWKKPQTVWSISYAFVLIMTNILPDLSGILEVLHCILVESPEALNIIQRGHIKSIISLLYKHGRNHKVGRNISAIA